VFKRCKEFERNTGNMEVDKVSRDDFVAESSAGGCTAIGVDGRREATEDTEDARLRALQVSMVRGRRRLVEEARCLMGEGGGRRREGDILVRREEQEEEEAT
jgi:hypothetical protein